MRPPDLHDLLDATAAQGLAAGLECDGLTRILHSRLAAAAVLHTVWTGIVATATNHSPRHWWIMLADGRIVDYAARMWLGDNPAVPHGIFSLVDHPAMTYRGQRAAMDVLSDADIQALLTPWPAEILAQLAPPPTAADPDPPRRA